ncbi:MAG: tetratricopeptide repeat protein [Isosphaeraceae bacterium]
MGRNAAIALAVTMAAGLALWRGGASIRAWRLRGEVERAYAAGDWPGAERAVSQLLAFDPSDAELIRLRVELATRRGDARGAAEALAGVPDASPEAASARLQQGLFLKELFLVREAEAAFRAAVRLRPQVPEPRRELANLMGIERRADEQRAELWGLHDRAGRRVEALRLLAQSVVVIPPGALAKSSDEGDVLRRCLEADPGDPHLRPPLARFHRRRGEVDAARRILDPWLTEHPDDVPARLEWLACLVDDGDVAAGGPWFETLRPEWAGLADYRRLRAEWLILQSRHAEALEELTRAEALNPLELDLPYARAQCARVLGKAAVADEALARHARLTELARSAAAVDEEGRDPAPLVSVGRVCESLGRTREARAWYEQALRLAPGHAEARERLSQLPRPEPRP